MWVVGVLAEKLGSTLETNGRTTKTLSGPSSNGNRKKLVKHFGTIGVIFYELDKDL